MIGPIFLLALVASAPQATDEPAARMVVLCSPRQYRFSIRSVAAAQPGDAAYPSRTAVDPETLMQWLPGETNEPEIRGPLIRYVRCGPYSIQLTGDAYNANAQGESGAYPAFASVRILRGNRTVYPLAGSVGTRLTECDRTLPRARPCPAGYATRVDGAYDAARKSLLLSEWVTSYDDDPSTARRVERHATRVDDDLTTWRSD